MRRATWLWVLVGLLGAGNAPALTLIDSEVYECTGELLDFVVVTETATFNARSGCEVMGFGSQGLADGSVMVLDQGTANFYAGSSIADDLEVLDAAHATVFGGAFGNDLEPRGGTLDLRGGFTWGDILENPELGATLRIFGACNEPPGPLARNVAINLVCTLEDGAEFIEPFFLNDTEGVVEIVTPEPALALLVVPLFLAAGFARRSRRR
jgi:hypothetical protein